MHEWFAQPIAAGRMAAARERATAHRLRVMRGRDLLSRVATSVADDAGGSTRLRRRRATAAAVVAPAALACC